MIALETKKRLLDVYRIVAPVPVDWERWRLFCEEAGYCEEELAFMDVLNDRAKKENKK
jgi:hypothetical protein